MYVFKTLVTKFKQTCIYLILLELVLTEIR